MSNVEQLVRSAYARRVRTRGTGCDHPDTPPVWCVCCDTGPRCEPCHLDHLTTRCAACGADLVEVWNGITHPIDGTDETIHGLVCVACVLDHELAS